MTAHRMYNLTCVNYDTCHEAYPGTIGVEDTTVRDLREQAAADGWEVMRGTHAGRDLGPKCRMIEIDSAVKARTARETKPDAPDSTGD
jgi:hypothetical protein